MNRMLRDQFGAKREPLAALCRQYRVARLDLFGSGTTGDCQGAESDLDFVVAFRPDPNGGVAHRYLGLAEGLEALFGRRVDLLTERSIRNPYFLREVAASREPVLRGVTQRNTGTMWSQPGAAIRGFEMAVGSPPHSDGAGACWTQLRPLVW